MRTLAIILFLLIASSLFAEDLQIYENYTKQYGDYYKPNGEIQEYESYVPKHGSYLKQEGKNYNNTTTMFLNMGHTTMKMGNITKITFPSMGIL